jgi:AAA family ATP:ADP antiporter
LRVRRSPASVPGSTRGPLMFERIASHLKLEPAELRRAILLGLTLSTLTGSYTLVKTARDALFLARMPATTLPYVFLGVGALTLAAASLFARATRNRATHETLAAGSLAAAVSLAAFALLFRIHASWVAIAFYLWVNVYGLLLFSQFWIYTNSMSHPREAKRIFGIVGVGGILGGLTGGLLAAPLAHGFGVTSMLLAASILLALVAPRVYLGMRHGVLPRPEPVADEATPPQHPLHHRYVRWLALAALCSVIVTGLLDYQFKVEIQRRFPSGADLASFLGLFYTAINLAALVVQLFATRWALQVLGAGWSAAVLPGGLGLGAAITMLVPGFGAVLGSRLWDQVMRQSINRSSVELFYIPLEPGLRRRARSSIEAGLERVGDGLAGLLILAAGAAMGAGTFTLAALIAAVVVVWIVAWMQVRRGYVTELGRNLRRMNLQSHHEPVSLREASMLREMARLLDSPYERVLIHGMTLLEENAPDTLAERVPSLLAHPRPAVRARALAAVAAHGLQGLAAEVNALVTDPDPDVRIAALRAHCTLGCDDPAGRIEEFLAAEDPRLRHAAIQLAVEFAPAGEELKVKAVLENLMRDGSSAERTAVAEALGRRAPPSVLHDLLSPLLRDADLETRCAALRSAGRAQRRNHIPALIEAIGARPTQRAARHGLAGFGDRVVGTLGDYLSDSSVATEIRQRLPYVLGDIASQESLAALLRCRETGDVRLWYRVLKAQNRMRAAGARVEFPRARVTEDLERDVRSYLFAYVHYRACPLGEKRSAERLFCIALNERLDQSLNRVFRRLALLYRPENMLAAYQGTVSDQPRLRGNAVEYLENALAPDHRALVLPLVADGGDQARLAFAEVRFGIRFTTFNDSLEAILAGEDQWLRTCALFVVGARKERALAAQVKAAASALDLRVRETALWASLAMEI